MDLAGICLEATGMDISLSLEKVFVSFYFYMQFIWDAQPLFLKCPGIPSNISNH